MTKPQATTKNNTWTLTKGFKLSHYVKVNIVELGSTHTSSLSKLFHRLYSGANFDLIN